MMPTIRRMTSEDIGPVYRIEEASFQTPWTMEAFEKEINENALAIYHVMELDGEVIGYGGMWSVMDELHITNFAVLPAFRGRGYAHVLMKALIDYGTLHGFKYMTLEVRRGNAVAISLYEKHGFEGIGYRPKYYVDSGEDALVMWKEL